MNHVMLDIETMGTTPHSAITAVAAVRFDDSCPEGGFVCFHRNVFWEGYMSPKTIEWWMEQSNRMDLFKDQQPLRDTLYQLRGFVGDDPVWGNGSDFDNATVLYRMNKLGLAPWSHRQNRCYRTLKATFPDINPDTPNLEQHNPLADAKHQAAHLRNILLAIRS